MLFCCHTVQSTSIKKYIKRKDMLPPGSQNCVCILKFTAIVSCMYIYKRKVVKFRLIKARTTHNSRDYKFGPKPD